MKFNGRIPSWQRNEDWFTSLPPDRRLMKKAKKWCHEYNSTGRFYYHYTNTRWWFEKQEDAVWFALHWGGKK